MRLLVFGPTGSVGRELVKQALEGGHRVTAFARDPGAVADGGGELTVVEGDVLDPDRVRDAMTGQEAVLSALGSPAFKNADVRFQGTRRIVDAMKLEGVERLVSLSTLGTGETWQALPLKYRLMFRTLLRSAFRAHEAQEECIGRSGLEWTIVRPGEYVDGARTGEYRHGFAPDDRTIRAEISRADVADFMLGQLDDHTYLRRSPGLSY